MSCENVFRDVCRIHARLFDHRSAFQGHINFFVKEFEEKWGEKEKTRLDHINDTVTQSKEHTLPNIQATFAEQLVNINERLKQATESCREIASMETERQSESDFLRCQREARQYQMDQFMEQQCAKSARVDQQYQENVQLFNKSYEELQQKLREGVSFSSQTYYKFMAQGKEFS